MKLVFPGGEHPQVMLGPGVSRVGSGPDANIVLASPGVKPRHCELHVTARGVMMQVPDGTDVRVNDRNVSGMIALRPGDRVAFEGVQARLASHDAAAPLPDAANAPLPAPANDDLAATMVRPVLPRYVLRGVSAAGFGRTFPLVGPTLLGRAPDCGVVLDHPGLSRHHARLTPTEEGLLVEDLGSTNGCLLNDVAIDRAWARHGDEIGVDTLRFRVVMPGAAEPVRANGHAARAARANATRTGVLAWVLVVAAAAALAALWLFATRA
ncbi:FHA domain-containing protein [Luteimonas aestuarii]|nr:FHA domain-containing protein [Luteimonas aestuarii]